MCLENSRHYILKYENRSRWKHQRLHKNVRLRFRHIQHQYITLLYPHISKGASIDDLKNYQRLLFGFGKVAHTYAIGIHKIFITCLHLNY